MENCDGSYLEKPELWGRFRNPGGTNVDSGTIQIANSSALGTGTVTVKGGELTTTGTITLNQQVDLVGGGAAAGVVSTTGTLTLQSATLGAAVVFGSPGHAGTVVIGPQSSTSAPGPFEVAFGTLRNGGGLGSFTQQAPNTTVDAGATLSVNDMDMTIANLEGAGKVTLGTKTATTLTLKNGSFSGVISGSGHVVTDGLITLLTGANTYTGGTMINAGTLQIGDGGKSGSIIGNVVDKGTLVFSSSGAVTFAGKISDSGSVTQAGTGMLTLSGNNNYTGGTTLSSGITKITNSNALGMGQVILEGMAELTSTGTVPLGQRVFLEGSSSTVSTTGTLTLQAVFVAPSTAAVFGSAGHGGTVVIGPQSGLGVGPAITLEVAFGTLRNGGGLGTLTGDAADTKVDAGATLSVNDMDMTIPDLQGARKVTLGTKAATTLTLKSATFAGGISGSGQMVADGLATSMTLLTGANTYTGGTTISAGTLQIGNGGTSGSLVGSVTDNSALVFERSNAVTFAGKISGSGTVTQQGTGTLTLSGQNSYTGGTTLSSGITKITNSNALGTGQVTLGGGELTSTGTVTLSNPVAFNSADRATVSTTGKLTLQSMAMGGIKAVFGSPGHAGTVVVRDFVGSIFSGGTVLEVAFGTLRNGGGLNHFTQQAGAEITVDAGATLSVNDTSMSTGELRGAGKVTLGTKATTMLTVEFADFAGVISGAGQVMATAQTVTLTGANTYTGVTTIANGVTLNVGKGGMTGSIVGNVVDNGELHFFRADTVTYAGIISEVGKVFQDGSGTLKLTGHNTYSGGTTINAGKVSINNSLALGAGEVTLNGAELTATGSVTLANEIAIQPSMTSPSTVSTTGTLGLSDIDMNAASVFGSAGHAGVVAVAAGTSTVQPGATVEVAFGTLRNDGGLGTFTKTVTSTMIDAGATLAVNDHGMQVKNVLGAGKITLGTNSATQLQLLAGNFGGVISGKGQVTTAGPVTLFGANTYTGGTEVQSGTTLINNTTGSGTGTGTVTVDGGATLGGKGKIGGPIHLLNGGIVEPGAGLPGVAGTVLHGSALLWDGGGELEFQVGGDADELILSGALTKGSGANPFTIELLDAGISPVKENFTLMTFASTTFSLSPADFSLVLPTGVLFDTLIVTSTHIEIDGLRHPAVRQEPAPALADAAILSAPVSESQPAPEDALTPTPEQTSGLLLVLGGAALLASRRRLRPVS